MGQSTYPSYTDVSRSEQVSVSAGSVCLKVFVDEDGSIEGSLVRRREDGSRPVNLDGDGSWYEALSDDERSRENLRRADGRARTQLKRFIRHHNLTRLLTFTNGGSGDGWLTRSDALDTVALWLKLYGGLLGDTPIALVAEQGARGGRWHVHAAIRNGYWLPYRDIIASWSQFMENRGYHSEFGHRFHAGDEDSKHRDGFTSARVCAVYLCKYLTKSMRQEAHESGTHRYRTAAGQLPPPTYAGRVRGLCDGWRAVGFCPLTAEVFPLSHTDENGRERIYGFLFDVGGET